MSRRSYTASEPSVSKPIMIWHRQRFPALYYTTKIARHGRKLTCPVFFTMMLSLCLSPTPRTYVATQYPAQESVKRRTASERLHEKKKNSTLEYSCCIPGVGAELALVFNESNCSHILIGSYWTGETYRWRHVIFFTAKIRFLRLFSKWPQKTSKCGTKISDTLAQRLVCHVLILFLSIFWTDQSKGERHKTIQPLLRTFTRKFYTR